MRKIFIGSVILVVAGAFVGCATTVADERAVCVIRPTEKNRVNGVVRFENVKGGGVLVKAEISGLVPNQKHAIHIHEFGDVTHFAGKSAGGHYNPARKPHGLPPSKPRHAGDLGNLEADANGKAVLSLKVDLFTVASVIGRAVVVHAKPDDGGQPTGNAGARIGVGVIGLSKKAE